MLTKPTNHVNAFFAITIFFLKIIFRFRTKVCNGYNLMQKARGFNDIAIASYKGNDYRIHFWYMSKDEAINILKNINLNQKGVS